MYISRYTQNEEIWIRGKQVEYKIAKYFHSFIEDVTFLLLVTDHVSGNNNVAYIQNKHSQVGQNAL